MGRNFARGYQPTGVGLDAYPPRRDGSVGRPAGQDRRHKHGGVRAATGGTMEPSSCRKPRNTHPPASRSNEPRPGRPAASRMLVSFLIDRWHKQRGCLFEGHVEHVAVPIRLKLSTGYMSKQRLAKQLSI